MYKNCLLSRVAGCLAGLFKPVLVILVIFIGSIIIDRTAFAFIDYKAIMPLGSEYAVIEVTPSRLQALISVESSNNPSAYNYYSEARGLTQITPIAWRELCKHYPTKYGNLNFREDMFKPQVAREAGKDYLYLLQNILKARRIPVTLDNLLAAYVWGPGNLEKKGIHNAPLVVKRYVLKVKRQAQVRN